MPRPRFHLRTLMIAVPVAGVILALSIRAAALLGSGREALVLVVLLSIAWVPAVFVFLPPKVAGWLFMLAISVSIYQACARRPFLFFSDFLADVCLRHRVCRDESSASPRPRSRPRHPAGGRLACRSLAGKLERDGITRALQGEAPRLRVVKLFPV